jgi:hypothetical protein
MSYNSPRPNTYRPPSPPQSDLRTVLELKAPDGKTFEADLATLAREEEHDYLDEFGQFRAGWLRITETNLGQQKFRRDVSFTDNGLSIGKPLAASAEVCFDFDLVIRGVTADTVILASDFVLTNFEEGEFPHPSSGVYDRRLVIPRPLGSLTLYMASEV